MSELPPLIPFGEGQGNDTAEKMSDFLDALYGMYLKTVAYGGLMFRRLPVRCQFRPETFGRHFAFWHMMQEGKVEDDRTIDPQRCERLLWISWVILNAGNDERIRVFRQAPRQANKSWALWLHEHDYAVILHERDGYFLLKTAFLVMPRKKQELERDWKLCQMAEAAPCGTASKAPSTRGG